MGEEGGDGGIFNIMYQYLLRAFKRRAKFKLHCLSTGFVCCDAPQISQFHNSLMQKIKTSGHIGECGFRACSSRQEFSIGISWNLVYHSKFSFLGKNN